jgi:hypothetical protein
METVIVNEKCLQIFKSFINDLCITFKEYSDVLTEKYSDVLKLETIDKIENCKLLNNFIDIIYKNNTKITKRDKTFFTDDVNLLEGISIKQLWNKDIKPKNRNTIWKYLQSFCIISINLKSSDELQNLLKNDEKNEITSDKIDKKDLKQLKKINMLNDELKETSNSQKKDSSIMNGFDMLEGSNIGKLAKDIAENINLEKTGLDKINTEGDVDISSILQNVNFGELFNTINEQVKSKFDNGELDQNTISKDAENMLPNMMNNPFFQQMMNQNVMGTENVD